MESYIQNAWNNVLRIISFMQDTVILTVGGVEVTFLKLLICTTIINFLIWVWYELLGLLQDVISWD